MWAAFFAALRIRPCGSAVRSEDEVSGEAGWDDDVVGGAPPADAGEAIAFIPNEIGRALLYNERITR